LASSSTTSLIRQTPQNESLFHVKATIRVRHTIALGRRSSHLAGGRDATASNRRRRCGLRYQGRGQRGSFRPVRLPSRRKPETGLAAKSPCSLLAFLTQNPAVLNSLRSAWLDVMGLPPILAFHATMAMDESGTTVVTPATTSAPSLVNNGIRKLHGTPFPCVWIPSLRCRTGVSTVISGIPSDKLQHFRSLTYEKANQPSRLSQVRSLACTALDLPHGWPISPPWLGVGLPGWLPGCTDCGRQGAKSPRAGSWVALGSRSSILAAQSPCFRGMQRQVWPLWPGPRLVPGWTPQN